MDKKKKKIFFRNEIIFCGFFVLGILVVVVGSLRGIEDLMYAGLYSMVGAAFCLLINAVIFLPGIFREQEVVLSQEELKRRFRSAWRTSKIPIMGALPLVVVGWFLFIRILYEIALRVEALKFLVTDSALLEILFFAGFFLIVFWFLCYLGGGKGRTSMFRGGATGFFKKEKQDKNKES